MNKLKQIREAVDSALEAQGLDSTRKLVFGCRVEELYIGTDGETHARSGWGIVLYSNAYKIIISDCFGRTKDFTHKELEQLNYKIIGRDIMLDDILLAYETMEKRERKEKRFCIHNDDFYCGCGLDYRKFYSDWKPTIPLHLQDDSTIDFLYELLTNNK